MFYSEEIVRDFDLRLLVIDDNEEITEAVHFFCESKKNIVLHGQRCSAGVREDQTREI